MTEIEEGNKVSDRERVMAREGMKKTLRTLFVKTIFPDLPIHKYNHALRCKYDKQIDDSIKEIISIENYVINSVNKAMQHPDIKDLIKTKAALKKLRNKINEKTYKRKIIL